MTETADFELHQSDYPKHKDVHGSFLTQAHIVARTNSGKTIRVSFWADKIGPQDIGWANGTVDNGPVFKLSRFVNPNVPYVEKVVDDVILRQAYSSLTVITPQFEIIVTPVHFFRERNVVGLHHRLDLTINLRVPETTLAVAPHGIIGQAWDGDGKAIDGEQDAWPESGEFTTYAMARGAIEGVPTDYKVLSPYATDFKFSRFDAKSSPPRDVAKLVAAGLLNAPKTIDNAVYKVGSTEYNDTDTNA